MGFLVVLEELTKMAKTTKYKADMNLIFLFERIKKFYGKNSTNTVRIISKRTYKAIIKWIVFISI